jgi:hypothetical protein
MNRVILIAATIAGLSTAGLSARASAQTWGAPTAADHVQAPRAGGWSLEKREQWMADMIDYAVHDHLLPAPEIEARRQELGAILTDHAGFVRHNGGLKDADGADLARRIDALNRKLSLRGRNPSAPWPSGS